MSSTARIASKKRHARAFARAAIGTVCVAAVALGGGTLSTAVAAVPSATSSSTVVPAIASDVAQQLATSSAMTIARATGEPTPVEGLTTPTEQTLAMPDGSMQYEASSVPVRVEQEGVWVPVDTSLAVVGEWIEPLASVAPVRFSRGGTDELGQVQTESGEWVSETWPYGVLPVPTLDGDTATYAEVLPDVDLKMVATKTGQAAIYVVKSEEAALSSKLADLHVIVEDVELREGSLGTVTAEVDEGEELVAGHPLWWDSSDGGTFREAGGVTPPMPVTHDVETDRVLLDVGDSVDKGERENGDVTYPVFIDPDWSSRHTESWYTDAAYPNQSYRWSAASNVLRVGIYQNFRSDMFFQFPIKALAGKVVTNARLNTTQLSVESSGAGAIQVHTYGIKPPGFTWAQEQAWNAAGTGGWSAPLQAPWYGPGYGSPAMSVGWNVTKGVQAKLGASDIQFAFTYTSPTLPSRRHYSRAATLVVTYNSLPNTPTAPAISSPSRVCGTAAAPAMVGQSDVAVSVNQTDPDAGNVGTNFYLATSSNLNSVIQTVGSGLGAQGKKTATFTNLADGEAYAWRARGQDATHASASYSAWCYFTVDTTKPDLPSITAAPDATYVVGEGVGLEVSGANDVAGFVYWTTPTPVGASAPPVPTDGTVSVAAALPSCSTTITNSVRWACKESSGATQVVVAPTDSFSTVWVSAYDKAGNQSDAVGYPLYPNGNGGGPALPADVDAGHAWQLTMMNSPLPDVIPDSNPWIGDAALDLLIPSNASKTATDLPDFPFTSPVMATTATSGNYETSSPGAPVDASKSFTFSVWVKPAQVASTSQVIAIQSGAGIGTMQLQSTSDGRYAFCLGDRSVNMSSTALESNCATGGEVVPGKWQMVTGIWDADNQQLRLLMGNFITPVAVNGHVNGAGDRTANGTLVFGPGPDNARFVGLLTNPVVVPGVIDNIQLDRLTSFGLPFTD